MLSSQATCTTVRRTSYARVGEAAEPPAARHLPLARWGLLFLLLLGEILWLTWLFDFGALARADTVWARALWYAPRALQLALVCGAALVFLAGLRLRGTRLPATHDSSWPYLFGHGLALAGFAVATDQLLKAVTATGTASGHSLIAWLALGATTGLCWCACVVSPSLWGATLRRGWGIGLAALAAGVSAWCLGRLLLECWERLGQGTLWLSAGLLRCLTREVVCRPEQFLLGTPGFVVEISPACSGYEGMGLMAVFVGLYLWLFRGSLRFPPALVLLPLGVALAWLANGVRIAALIAVGTWLSPAVAKGGFHSQAGSLAFLGLALGLVSLSQANGVFRREPAPARTQGDRATAAYLMPLLVLLGTQMITGALSSDFDRLYPVRVLTTGLVLWFYWPCYAELRGKVSPEAVGWGLLVFALWVVLEPWASSQQSGLVEHLGRLSAGERWCWLVARVLGSVVTVPLAEELAFRGYLLRRLQAADFRRVPAGRFTAWSFLLSSVLFGLLHGRWLAGTLAGMVFAVALYRRRSLGDAVVAHAVANALIALAVVACGAWQLWM